MAGVLTEQWKPIPGWEGRYEVSDSGRVASLPTRTWPTRRLIAVVLAKRGGYPSVMLRRNGQQWNRKVHQLVCEAFHGPRPPGMVTRHLDGDPTNNHAANLAWGTHSENNQDAVAHGTHWQASRAECVRGHSLSGANLYITPSTGARQCRACQSGARSRHAAPKVVA